MIRKKVKHIYFKSFIDNADIINTHNYFTSYSEFFNPKYEKSMIRINAMRAGSETVLRILKESIKRVKECS